MTAEVHSHPDGLWPVVRFGHDRDLVEYVKASIPSIARRWHPETKTWFLNAYYAHVLAGDLTTARCRVTGLEPEPAGHHRSANGADWAKLLLKSVGPTRAEPVFKALTRILHPDNQETGDAELQRHLNDARAEMENI